MNYFEMVIYKLNTQKYYINVLHNEIQYCANDYAFGLFKFGISNKIKNIYNLYSKFFLTWECNSFNIRGFVYFVSYEKILPEHDRLCEMLSELDNELIYEQNKIIEDISHWYPIFIFPNGDKFCYDDRNGKIVFFEHDVFDCGANLHGLVIAESMDDLLEKWSKVLFVDIYDWYEGVDECGIDINKSVYKPILQILN